MSESELTEIPLTGDVSEDLHLLIDGVQDYAIFMLDPDGYIVTWNPGAERIKGYTAEEAIGRHFSIFYSEQDVKAGKPERILQTAVLEGKIDDQGWRVRKDGGRFWASVLVTALKGPGGSLRGFAKITRDETERRRAEESLHQSEQRFRLLVESLSDYAIFMLSTEGRIISWNSGAQRIKGYSAEEILGSHFSVFYPKEDVLSDKPAQELETAVAEGRYEEEGWRLRKDGTRFWADVVITPIRDQGGVLLGFAKVTRDLTERRLAREELQASQEQARDLSVANAAKEELLGIVAHEIRTPLSVLYGSARLLDSRFDTLTEETRRDLVQTLAQEANYMRELVENLLSLARPVSAETLSLVEADLQECITAAVAAFELRSPRRTVQIKARQEAIKVGIDRTNFDRVLQNLLDNAHKYSSEEAPIEVVIEERAGRAVVEVQDRGPGLDPAELERIFDSFYRSPRTATGAYGSGLGLTVCKRLMEAMGGTIEARLRAGGGLVLRLSLPRFDCADEA